MSNEIVHVTDLFTTLAKMTAATVPVDRPIDGIDQTQFLLGQQPRSDRESALMYISGDLHAVKWRNWKAHYYWEIEPQSGKDPFGSERRDRPPHHEPLGDGPDFTDRR